MADYSGGIRNWSYGTMTEASNDINKLMMLYRALDSEGTVHIAWLDLGAQGGRRPLYLNENGTLSMEPEAEWY